MRFQICKTSASRREEGQAPPHPRAFPGEYTYVDTRNVDSPDKLLPGVELDWHRRGTNHRVVNGFIKRDLGPEPCWLIDIESLADLISIIDDSNESIVISTGRDHEPPRIEIYDDYRE